MTAIFNWDIAAFLIDIDIAVAIIVIIIDIIIIVHQT
jgi:hypothetical protein